MLGQRLRLARKKAGFSMRELAERLSPPVTAQAISKYEAGRMMPSSAVLIGIMHAHGSGREESSTMAGRPESPVTGAAGRT